MYCIIQEIPTKKPNKGGYSKELKVEYMKMTIMSQDESHYYYTTKGKFDRPIKKAYKISIHQSYRECNLRRTAATGAFASGHPAEPNGHLH